MIRRTYIEQVRRLIYNGQPHSDATVTVGLVNTLLPQAIGVAAQKNYTDSIQLDGIAYVNNSFYTTYKNLAVTKDELYLYKVTLPHIPMGLGADEGIETCILYDSSTVQNSYPVVMLTQNQKSYSRGMRTIPNKLIGYSEGIYVYILSTLFLNDFTAKVTMVSGGLDSNLDGELNVPSDYLPYMTDYLFKYFMKERSVPVNLEDDGLDIMTKTA